MPNEEVIRIVKIEVMTLAIYTEGTALLDIVHKQHAMVVDGRVIWAPLVRAEFSKEAVLTGNGPHGLTQEG